MISNWKASTAVTQIVFFLTCFISFRRTDIFKALWQLFLAERFLFSTLLTVYFKVENNTGVSQGLEHFIEKEWGRKIWGTVLNFSNSFFLRSRRQAVEGLQPKWNRIRVKGRIVKKAKVQEKDVEIWNIVLLFRIEQTCSYIKFATFSIWKL